MRVQTDHFNWKCANVLEGSGDGYSIDGAAAFKKAASVKICSQIYTPGSTNMEKYIRDLLNKCTCGVTVVFAKFQDLVSLFVEASKQKYSGEWVVGDSLFSSIDDVVRKMTDKMSESSVHEMLRGMCSLDCKEIAICKCITASP